MARASFVPHVETELREMLDAIGVACIDDLFRDIPAEFQRRSLNIPKGQSELEIIRAVTALATKNRTDLVCFLGGGFYDHYRPAAVDAMLARGEFLTAYTPYQPEVAQGTLQAMFEFQSAVCRLTEMDVANASLYDGGTAIYEAAMMAARITGRAKILVDEGVNPIYRKMLRSYTTNLDIAFEEVPVCDGHADRERFIKALDGTVAGVVLQNPNFFGCIDDLTDVIAAAHKAGAMAVMSVYPVSLGMLKTPGAMDADIVVGEGQSLGLPLNFGGPYLGFMATRRQHVRKMPGRIAGMTRDAQGRRGFVLTLQAREQHIRLEKATSNICTNENLCALAATVYIAMMGRHGIRRVAELCADNASYAYHKLLEVPGVERTFSSIFFNEFCITLPRDARDVVGELVDRGYAAGFPVGRYYKGMENVALVAVTEMRTKEEIDGLAAALESII
ncbi:aminomethyl-transferring glycine dehydrogenase subunit GcvPA [bacterium]|nr:aminomethyl-transferring glycine dehydrogenase subunit GcvPA [bacterium]